MHYGLAAACDRADGGWYTPRCTRALSFTGAVACWAPWGCGEGSAGRARMLIGLSMGFTAVTTRSTAGSDAWGGAWGGAGDDDDWGVSVFAEGAQYVELFFFPALPVLSVALGTFTLSFLVLAFFSLRTSFLMAAI